MTRPRRTTDKGVPYQTVDERGGGDRRDDRPCRECDQPVGNPVFTVCDDCWPESAIKSTCSDCVTLRTELDQIKDRIATIADEESGPYPPGAVGESLTCIEAALFNRRKTETGLRTELEQLKGQMTEREKSERFSIKSGPHLGAARRWMQRNCRNGSDIIWGSQDRLGREFTAADIDELAQRVADAAWADRDRGQATIERLRKKLFEAQCDTGIAAAVEREACAVLAEDSWAINKHGAMAVATAIRARGTK